MVAYMDALGDFQKSVRLLRLLLAHGIQISVGRSLGSGALLGPCIPGTILAGGSGGRGLPLGKVLSADNRLNPSNAESLQGGDL